MSLLVSALPASFFVAYAATDVTIFSDDFEIDDDTFANWDVAGSDWSNIAGGGNTGTRKARLVGNSESPSAQLKKTVSTVGYENIVVSFAYQGSLNGNDFAYGAYSFDGVNFINLSSFNSNVSGEWQTLSTNIPAGADNNPNFTIEFNGALSAGSDEFDIDTVRVSGDDIETAPAPTLPSASDMNNVFECWEPDFNNPGKYIAHFGFENKTGVEQNIPFGPNNTITPNTFESFFPETFDVPVDGPRPGRTPFFPNTRFSIDNWDGSNIVWNLLGGTDTAGLSGPKCADRVFEMTSEVIIVSDDTAAGENQPGWLFNRDLSTAIPFEFNTVEQSIGTGALNVLPIGVNPADKFIGEYFHLEEINNLESFSYDYQIGTGGADTDANEFYLNVYANYGESSETKFYDCRYNVVPSTGSTGSFTTVTFDPTQSYPVTTRTGGEASPYTCPAVPADMDLQSPGSVIRAFAINTGDTTDTDQGLDGFFDNVVLVENDYNTFTRHTTTYDFEPAPVVAPTVEITACKYDSLEESVAGWDMFFTNDPIGDDGISYEVTTGEDGCVTQEVDPTEGPFYVVEQERTGWEQSSVYASFGEVVNLGQSEILMCEFFGLQLQEVTDGLSNTLDVPNIVAPEFRCDFYNEEIEICEDESLVGADSVVTSNQLLLKNGSPITDVNRTNPDKATGPADWVPGTGTNFFSLGFGGSIELEFDKYVLDLQGTDFTVFEGTNGATYPEESALVEVSQNGTDWEEVGTASSENPDRQTEIDFSSTGLPWIKFVRVTDTTNPAPHTNDADAFDLDAVVATEVVCEPPVTEPERGQVIVKKVIVGDEEITPDYFNFFYTLEDVASDLYPFEEDGENLLTLDAGTYSFVEIKLDGWSTTYEGCTDVVVGSENTPVCTITNTKVLQCVPGVNLLENGSFEEPTLDPEGFGWDIFDSVVNGLAWAVEWVTPSDAAPTPAKLELQNGRTASEGTQFAELDSNWNNAPGGPYNGEDTRVMISQTIETIPGEEYEYTFDFSALPKRGLNNNVVQVLVDGVVIDTVKKSGIGNTDTEWSTHTYLFVATDTTTTVGLADAGRVDSFGTLVDNVSLTCNLGPEVGPYCGDEEINQAWEQCEVGDENCTDYCRFDNQCQADTYVKVTLDSEAPASASFDGQLYLGDSDTIIPSGAWFPFSVLGDATAQSIANNRDGMAIQRDTATGELKLAVVGNDGKRKIDYVEGTVELVNATFGDINRQLVPGYKLETLDEEDEGSHQDDFIKDTPTTARFEWKVFGSNDAVRVGIIADDITCEEGDVERYRIEGTVWHDRDESGERENPETEESLGGWKVFITNGVDSFEALTDDMGNYFFEVPAGTWTITQEDRSGWSPTFPTPDEYEVTVPEPVIEASLLNSVLDLILPTAHAATIILDTLTGYDFGNIQEVAIITTSGGGGGGGGGFRRSSSLDEPTPEGLVAGVSTSTPEGAVLGDQVSIMPYGAPNAGFGGTSTTSPVMLLFATLTLLILVRSRDRRYATK